MNCQCLEYKSKYDAELNENIWKLYTNKLLLRVRHTEDVRILKFVTYNCKPMAVAVVQKLIVDNYQTAINNTLSLKDLHLRLFFAELLALAENFQLCLSVSCNLSHMSGLGCVKKLLDRRLIVL